MFDLPMSVGKIKKHDLNNENMLNNDQHPPFELLFKFSEVVFGCGNRFCLLVSPCNLKIQHNSERLVAGCWPRVLLMPANFIANVRSLSSNGI